jgi:hypothetical protein
MLFPRFKDEAAFREDFVRPLLTQMGFHGIAHTHGAREFGKDFVFSELTRFGFIRYSAAQVKHEEKIAQTQKGKITELVEQIRQAFSVPFTLPDSPRERFVSSVYVFNSGEITEGAKDHLLAELTRERFGDNVHVFDGDRLEMVSRFNSIHREETLRPMLTGLEYQLRLNISIWQNILDILPQVREARGSMLAAIEAFISVPFLTDRLSVNAIVEVWQQSRIIDSITQRYLSPALGIKAEIKKNDLETLKSLCEKSILRASEIIKSVETCYGLFKPL